jgi:hypothetical protein
VEAEYISPAGDEVQDVPLLHGVATARCWRRKKLDSACRNERRELDSGLHDGIARWPVQDSWRKCAARDMARRVL